MSSRTLSLRSLFRAAARRPLARTQFIRPSGTRFYSSPGPQIPSSSNTPWIIGSVGATALGLAFILSGGQDSQRLEARVVHESKHEETQEELVPTQEQSQTPESPEGEEVAASGNADSSSEATKSEADDKSSQESSTQSKDSSEAEPESQQQSEAASQKA